MLTIPDHYLTALTSSSAVKVIGELRTGGKTYELQLRDWTVRADETQISRYSCDLTLAAGTDPRLLRPYGATVKLWHRVTPAGLDTLDLPAGVHRLTSRGIRRPDGQLQVHGSSFETQVDRWKFGAPRTITDGSTIYAIKQLIRECFPDAQIHVEGDLVDKRVPRITYAQQRWGAIRADQNSLGRSIGAAVFHHATGAWRIQPGPLLSNEPVWSCLEGAGGALVTSDDSVDDSQVINCWAVAGQRSDGVQIARAWVVDDDPYSPTYAKGVSLATGDAFGRYVGFLTSPLLEDDGEALRAGLHRLATSTGLSEALSLTSVANPALEVGDTIQTSAGQVGWKRIVSSITWTPGAMSIGTRVVRTELY